MIRNHLGKNPSCKKEYSTEELAELKRQYDVYRKNYRAKNYQTKKNVPSKVKNYIGTTENLSE